MNGYLGSYRHSLDAKGRVSLPASFRRETEEEGFVLLHFHPDALTLYPENVWQAVETRLREMLERRPDFRHRLLRVTGNALRTKPDGQGRILIPDRLRQEVGLGGEALIVGALDKIEIWDPDRFEASTEVDREEFDRVAASIFA